MTLSFLPAGDGPGIVVVDAIERRQFRVSTPDDVEVTERDPDRFRFPVDEAVSLSTSTVVLPRLIVSYVRDADGELRSEIESYGTYEFPAGQYSLEISAPIKCYLRVEGPLTIETTDERMEIDTRGEEVLLGARSHHERPEATITTTDEPRDLMRAVSALGSALKTISPERSYPTLRGHPPELELGEELAVPEQLERPKTGIRIELPATRRHVYPVATLAYYLGAEVVPGPAPRIVTDNGFEYPLDTARGYEAEIERALKGTFFLDCVTRTEGLNQVDLHERNAIEGEVSLDFATLYDRSPAERLAVYLDVPYDAVAEHVPEWKLTAHVPPTPENAELLPFLVDDLAVIRSSTGQHVSDATPPETAVDAFSRGASGGTSAVAPDVGAVPADDFTRSARGSPTSTPSIVQPGSTDSLELAWAGERAPLGASKVSVEAFRNRLDREPSRGEIDITVVCNDDEMDEEQDLAAEVYGSHEDLPFEVQRFHDLSTDVLRTVIETETDFLHYIGHIDDAGFECTDGTLDVREIERVGVDAFFLNACTSYEQGMAMIERGAAGGVVTLADVLNSGAVRIGKTMVRLLNHGYPLRAALNIAEDQSIVGGHYIVVGDGNVEIAQAEGGTPLYYEAERDDNRIRLSAYAYPTDIWGMGSLTVLFNEHFDEHYLTSGKLDTARMSTDEFFEYCSSMHAPINVDGELYWSGDLDYEDLRVRS